MMMSFADPIFLLFLPLLALLLWDNARRGRDRKPAVGYSDLALVRWSSATRHTWQDHLPLALSAMALVLLVVALARPQGPPIAQEAKSTGIEVMLCLDTSGSMAAMDLSPNRLVAAQNVTLQFVSGRPGDRIGLVNFGGAAITQCPLTLDHASLKTMLGASRIGMTKVEGTAIGSAIATAVNRLKDTPGKSKIVVLVTDGKSNVGEIDPITAAKLATKFGVKIYAIGVGVEGEVPMPVEDPVFGRRTVAVQGDLDEPTLRKVAEVSGGRFFRATDNNSLTGIYREIDRLEKSELTGQETAEHEELYGWFLVPALTLLGVGLGLERTLLREVP